MGWPFFNVLIGSVLRCFDWGLLHAYSMLTP